MVSFWPFKGQDTSAASFEKTLSQLSTKINKVSVQNDGFRQRQRRYKVLWTLYSTFVYILVALILTLVTGWERWGAVEYTAVAGGPVLIYGVRTAVDAYYNYRISTSQNYLNDLNKQRDTTIEKLKTATKYNSTQQLLDKYGGTPDKRQPSPPPDKKGKQQGVQHKQNGRHGARTGFIPPPTANIPGKQSPMAPQLPSPASPELAMMAGSAAGVPSAMLPANESTEPSEEFAPNAFSATPRPATVRQPSSQYATEGPKWYDRILDVVLGDDETQAKNRIALICQNCRLVNGLAPPGVRSLEEVGKWRCSSCQAMNGVESEEKKILKEIAGESATSPVSSLEDTGAVNRERQQEHDDIEEAEDYVDDQNAIPSTEAPRDTTPAGSTRSKTRQRKKA